MKDNKYDELDELLTNLEILLQEKKKKIKQEKVQNFFIKIMNEKYIIYQHIMPQLNMERILNDVSQEVIQVV